MAQGLTLPGHLGSVPTALGAVLSRYQDDINEGDVRLNDPYEGGMHLLDLFVIKPIFHEGHRVAFACVSSHHVDTGGRVPGQMLPTQPKYIRRIADPPTKLYAGGNQMIPVSNY